MRFQGKTALVTGGAKGIGAATAARLASEGATVVVADFDEVGAQDTAGSFGGHAVRCDVTSLDDVNGAVAKAVEVGGSLDVLVTCAGITRDNLLFKMSDEDWDAVIDTHLKGTFYAARAAQAQMVEQKSGKMVLISSVSALGNRGQTNYSTAKAGLQGMTKTLSIELGPFGVNVNCIAPGFIETDMTRATAERIGVPFDAFKEHAAKEIPVRRVGQPEDIAGTVAFLCSEDAGFISGQVIYVAGGPRT
ncbi:MAG TPA: 3-oxoacyl-ACP reductase FabG [Gaiellaceae bacterium]|jgi:3-oxoacyl-[acyl-carrier protein] reductase|nr:3-oxoacyl-ACP reductase FabG [Gaiellaceae bacterium]